MFTQVTQCIHFNILTLYETNVLTLTGLRQIATPPPPLRSALAQPTRKRLAVYTVFM